MITLFLGILLIYNLVKNYHALHIFQQNLYNTNNRYLKWIKKRKKEVFLSLDILIIILLIFSYKFKILIYISGLFYLFNCLYLINYYKNMKVKKPFIITKRIIRLNITYYLLFLIPIIIYFIKPYNYLLLILSIFTYFNYFIIYLVNIINKPIEKLVYKYYERLAKKKLHSMPNLKVIGITGSYGKTSSKNILSHVLSSKYIVRPTPRNLNTPYGLMITINSYLDKFDEVLIAEMGAYVNLEIKEMCDFVKPKYAILTVIGEAHLETFKTRENICKTKFELVESLPSDGVCVLNKDDPYQVEYVKNSLKNKDVKIIWIGINNKDADFNAINIKSDKKGMSFDVSYQDNLYHVETKLLGFHNVSNILASIALGVELKVPIMDMIKKIKSLMPIEHRLEIKKINNITMIDDAYNSNPTGAKNALKVLEMMDGIKVIVTPGMVELGAEEESLNYEFGKNIASVCDYAILIGEKRCENIKRGILESGFKENHIIILNRVVDAFNKLEELKRKNSKEEVFALFENDLPDIYSEGGSKNEN